MISRPQRLDVRTSVKGIQLPDDGTAIGKLARIEIFCLPLSPSVMIIEDLNYVNHD
jgi:hypothetical protein